MKLSVLILVGSLILGLYSYSYYLPEAKKFTQVRSFSESAAESPANAQAEPQSGTLRFRLDAKQSRFMVRAFSGGLLWFKGHDHFIAVRDFTGEAQVTRDAINPASLQFTVKAESLEETRDVFTEPQKQIINKEIRELVLETAKYPEIIFQSTDVTGQLNSSGQYQVRIGGNLTLHGVTRRIVIPATVILSGSDLRASGEFSVNRSDYKIDATSAFHGMIRVRDKLKFTFEIVGHQY
jgi:polyisoprenoid-binding protein YceI